MRLTQIFATVKKLGTYDTPIRFWARKWAIHVFFQHPKFGIQIRLQNSMKIFIFYSKIFFRTSLKNFSWVQHGCSRYLEGMFYLQVYVEKIMKVIQHKDQNIFGKNYPPPKTGFGRRVDSLNESLTWFGATCKSKFFCLWCQVVIKQWKRH